MTPDLPVLPPGAAEAAIKAWSKNPPSGVALAVLRALAAEPEPVRQGFARFLHPEAYEAGLTAAPPNTVALPSVDDLTDPQADALLAVAVSTPEVPMTVPAPATVSITMTLKPDGALGWIAEAVAAHAPALPYDSYQDELHEAAEDALDGLLVVLGLKDADDHA